MSKNSILQLASRPAGFLSDVPVPGDGIAISSRIRLARNLSGYPFPCNASAALKREVAALVMEAAAKSRCFPEKSSMFFPLSSLGANDLLILLERRLASREFISAPDGAVLITTSDERLSVMVNEEDQLRIQAVMPGFQLGKLWKKISSADDKLGANLSYAWDEKFGFLTACPSNTGTGLRASVMLHLPALVITGLISPTLEGIKQLNLAVRGLRGEGTKNHGNLFQISNQRTLGVSEEQSISELSEAIVRIIEGEKEARRKIMESKRTLVYDKAGRAYGCLKYGYSLPLDEAFYLLSCLRLGVNLGLFNAVDIPLINKMQLAIQPGHLGCMMSEKTTPDDCDERRAMVCRTLLKKGAAGRAG